MFRLCATIPGVQRLRNTLFLLAAILWVPLSAHCQLENIPGLEFLACPSDSESAGGESDCGDTGCCLAEKSHYKSDQIRVTIPSPNLLPLSPVALADIAATLSDEISAAAFADAPPELPNSWQFVFRTASSPRAPSLAS